MNVSTLQPGDLVRCDVRGTTFFARVVDFDGRLVHIDPERVNAGRTTHRFVTARQVVGIYRATAATRRADAHQHNHEMTEAA